MTSTPRILHFVTPDSPGAHVVERINKIIEMHKDWCTYIWTDTKVPENGALARFYKKANSGAQRADLIRIDAIMNYGGIYMDSDFIIHRELGDIADHCSFFVASEDGEFPTNALFGGAKGHPAIEAISRYLENNEPDWSLPPNETTGPHLFKNFCQWRSDIEVLPRQTFYPYKWDEAAKPKHRLSVGTHLWDGSWLPKDRAPEENVAVGTTDLTKRLQIEIAKFCSTIGFKQLGGALWDKAHGLERRPSAAPDSAMVSAASSSPQSTSYTVGDDLFVRTKHGTILVCDGRDLSITPHLALNGFYELAEENFLLRTLRGGDWYVDVGANIGNHAVLAATCVGPFGRVFAFEPNKRCSGLLRQASVVNWVHDRIKIIESGVSDQVGEVSLTYNAALLGGASINQGDAPGDCLDATLSALGESMDVTIKTTTLDDVFPVALPMAVLKIDAEGHEPAILRGASKLLEKRAVDYVMLESVRELAAGAWSEHIAAYEMLVRYGYAVARLNEDGSLVRHESLSQALRSNTSRTLIFHVPDGGE